MISGQLELDLAAAMPPDEDEMIARLRAQVAEPGMSEDEISAAVADARQRLDVVQLDAQPAKPCICDHPQVFVDAFAEDRTCNRCGREPRS